MKRLRLQLWTGQLSCSSRRPCCAAQRQVQKSFTITRTQATSASPEIIYEDGDSFAENARAELEINSLPSPLPSAALSSAKLAALHARLSLPQKLPLQTLSRTLIDVSADSSPSFNNASLAQVGSSLLSYQVSEWLLCTYPRLPMTVLFAAMSAYIGPATMMRIGIEWGVETAAAPGSEVDPGLLQFSKIKPGTPLSIGTGARPDSDGFYRRRGISSRIVYDDEFGDLITKNGPEDPTPTANAYAGFVKALVGAVYVHAGMEAAQNFIKAHILSRHLPISKLFYLKNATRDLARLCARENFDPPVARLLSETGRLSRSPVFVVGIFSGPEKLGEGAGPSLDEGRNRAAVAALKSWYLYSPMKDGRKLPSEVGENDGSWPGVHIDMGEVI